MEVRDYELCIPQRPAYGVVVVHHSQQVVQKPGHHHAPMPLYICLILMSIIIGMLVQVDYSAVAWTSL